MLILILVLAFFCGFTLVAGLFSFIKVEERPTLKILADELPKEEKEKKKFLPLNALAFFNAPLCAGALGEKMRKDLAIARDNRSPEAFILFKEILIAAFLFVTYPMSDAQNRMMWLLMMVTAGYYLPDFLLKMKIQKIKNSIIRHLPDTIDLLSLCVNAGLDFLLALKWVIEKSTPSILIVELQQVMQEVNIGKPRRDALTDFANKYQIPDLSTFTRALVQADRMGTSVADALNIIAEDMRISRFRRGEQTALKAPLKMLIPLLFFIFPVVGILVAGPVLLQFMQGDTISKLAG
jgi:pilus assembly protein TadC